MTRSVFRVAFYFAPREDDPLWRAGCRWLGRDAKTSVSLRQPGIPGIDAATATPRRYGFHATLKPPFVIHPSTSFETVVEAATRLGAEIDSFPLPPLTVSKLDDFVAIREEQASKSLRMLADRFVRGLDFARAAQTEDELARRGAAPLSDRQGAMLARWGYPYVFDEWKFHFTLTAGQSPVERSRFASAARVHFADALSVQRWVDNVAVFVQPARNEPFTLVDRVRLAASVR